MNYNIKTIPKFEKNLKKLAKKFPSLKYEYITLIQTLKEKPEQGTPLDKNCYKIRIAIASKRKGKSGGARIITNFIISDKIVYLLTIYDKSDKDNLSKKELQELLESIPN